MILKKFNHLRWLCASAQALEFRLLHRRGAAWIPKQTDDSGARGKCLTLFESNQNLLHLRMYIIRVRTRISLLREKPKT